MVRRFSRVLSRNWSPWQTIWLVGLTRAGQGQQGLCQFVDAAPDNSQLTKPNPKFWKWPSLDLTRFPKHAYYLRHDLFSRRVTGGVKNYSHESAGYFWQNHWITVSRTAIIAPFLRRNQSYNHFRKDSHLHKSQSDQTISNRVVFPVPLTPINPIRSKSWIDSGNSTKDEVCSDCDLVNLSKSLIFPPFFACYRYNDIFHWLVPIDTAYFRSCQNLT